MLEVSIRDELIQIRFVLDQMLQLIRQLVPTDAAGMTTSEKENPHHRCPPPGTALPRQGETAFLMCRSA